MAQISNYLYSNINPYLNSLQEKYELNNIHPYVKNKRFSSNNIFSNYSIFDNKTNELQNINTNNNYNDNNTNINYYDFGPYMDMPLSYELKKEKKYMNKSSEQDLNMMKLQLRCDLIGQKINQIQNQVQNFRESSSKDDKKILKKNRTYGNLNENKNLCRNKNSRRYEDNVYEQKNFFKIPIPRKKEVGLSDAFRKKKNINNKRGHNISYINKNISSNYLINDYSNKIGNFRQSFFFNTMNKPNKNKSINGNNRETKNNKIIINKISSNPNILKQKNNNIVQFNNYVVDDNVNNNFVPNSNTNTNKKTRLLIRKNFSTQRSKSNNISPNKNNLIIKNRKQNGINQNINYEKSSNSVAKYGSFDQYFFNDNNYADNSYIKYIDTIKNNFNSINYNNLDNIKYNSFNNSKIIEPNQIIKNNFVIQKGNDINIINQRPKTNQKSSNITTYNNKNYQIVNNYNKSFDKNKASNIVKDRINKKSIKGKTNSYKNKGNKINNQKTQINNNFNVNNNTNYYNFNYNQNTNNNNNNKQNYMNKYKNMKNNKVINLASKNNIKGVTQKNIQKDLLKDNNEESSTNEYLRINHDYSNDDLMPPSDMFNSVNNNINFELIKKPSINSENKMKTNINSKRKKGLNPNNYNYKKLNKV